VSLVLFNLVRCLWDENCQGTFTDEIHLVAYVAVMKNCVVLVVGLGHETHCNFPSELFKRLGIRSTVVFCEFLIVSVEKWELL
jgi:hypothetical protein